MYMKCDISNTGYEPGGSRNSSDVADSIQDPHFLQALKTTQCSCHCSGPPT